MSFIVYVTTKIIIPYQKKIRPFFEFVILAIANLLPYICTCLHNVAMKLHDRFLMLDAHIPAPHS